MFLLQPDIFLWDLAILIGMTVCFAGGIGCLVLAKKKTHTLCRSLLCILSFFSFFSFFTIVYSSFIEPQIIVVHRETLTHPQAQPLTIAIISDLHVGPYKGKAFLQRVVRKINATFPDIVLIPGDFVFTRSADLSDLDPLKDLRTSAGVYAVLGNHDVGQYQSLFGKRYSAKGHGDSIAKKLSELDVTVLRNENVTLNIPDRAVIVAGIDDLWTGHYDLHAALDSIEPSAFTILLSHNPSVIKEPLGLDAQLIVAGHTHGGQIRLPFIGAIPHLPTNLGQSYDKGLFSVDKDSVLAITSGVSESSARTRFLTWPEILLIELQN